MQGNKKSKYWVMGFILLVASISIAVTLGSCIDRSKQDVTYKNDNYGFSVVIPGDVAADTEIREEGNVVYFLFEEIQGMSPDTMIGIVGMIEMYDKNISSMESMMEREDTYNLRYLGENEFYYFGWAHATDVQYPVDASEQLKEKYSVIEGKFDEIINSIKISNEFKDISEKRLSFITDFDEVTGVLTFDEIEWVGQMDVNRINELELDAQLDFPNGFYIHNESDQQRSLEVSEDVEVYIVNWSDLANPLLTDINGLTQRMAEYEAPYHLTIKDGVIVKIVEQYRP